MAVTSSTFLARFPEFNNLETTVISATIGEAERQNSSDVWGDQYDDAVNYMAAHLLGLPYTVHWSADWCCKLSTYRTICGCSGPHFC